MQDVAPPRALLKHNQFKQVGLLEPIFRDGLTQTRRQRIYQSARNEPGER
jgi:hypothetical protein